MSRRICVVTGTRAEYGLLRWMMEGVRESKALTLQVVVTGMHLSPEFGLTYREIVNHGFTIDRKVEMLLSSDTPVGVGKSIGLGVIGFAEAFAELAPDIVVLLGDRFEMLAAATAAMVSRIPMAHLHGGEATEGLIDEAIRHAITKMAHLHFVAAEEYRRRVIQLGEQPDRVYLVGGLGVDSVSRETLMEKAELERVLGFEFQERNLLVTFHAVSLEYATAQHQMGELLAALREMRDTGLIFTMPNADTDGRALFNMINEFVSSHEYSRAFTSLGQQKYLSCLQFVDGVVGNSSSGLTEVPSFKRGTINIGDRQRGRLKATSVIDSAPDRSAIRDALTLLYSNEFQAKLETVKNPYGDSGASARIVEVLAAVPLENVIKKQFFDTIGTCG